MKDTHPMMRLAVVAPNWIGDAVMSLPLVGALAASEVRTSIIAREYVARVYAGVDGVAELVVGAGGARARRIFRLARTLDALACDATVVLPPSFSAALGSFFGGARNRVGYATDARRALLHDALDARGLRTEHVRNNYMRLGRRAVERAGGRFRTGHEPSLIVHEKDGRAAGVALARAGVPGFGDGTHAARGAGGAHDDSNVPGARIVSNAPVAGGTYVVIVPGATYGPAKTWPADRFKELARKLSSDLPVVLAGSEADRARCESMASGLRGVFSVAGGTSIGAFFALLQGARAVVANDSGAVHVSATLGVPTVVLFGSTSPIWTAPRGPSVDIVREPVACSPCFRRTCPTHLECFAGIDVSRVLTTVRDRLSSPALAGGCRPA